MTGPELWVHLRSHTPAFTLTLGPAGSNQPQEPRAPRCPLLHSEPQFLCAYLRAGETTAPRNPWLL